ncbi:MAG: hypothetical protein M3P12_00445 [Gemmatimonadota bacterium]|nr:hypothetical protein [Gemmatimonadota bacterium]
METADATARQELFEDRYLSGFLHPEYDVDRTGKTFVLLQPVGTAEIIVVVNGLSKILSAASEGH